MRETWGILTFHDTTNFGSALQSYALCKAMRNLNQECEIIDYKCDAVIERELGTNKNGSLPKRLLRYFMLGRHAKKKYDALNLFLNSERMLSKEKYDKSSIKDANDKYQNFLVGSDIVWGVDITKNDMTYFLDFVQDNRGKFAFSSSIGDRFPYEQDQVIGEYLKRFDKICVRETDAVQIVKEVSDIDAKLVCDPTMLIEQSVWKAMASEKYKNKNYVLVYFANDKLINVAKEYAAKIGAKVLVINYGLSKKGVSNIKPYTISDFLSLIMYAKAVFTGSYHGMLFSMYFHKNFIINNRAHGSRMKTIIELFDLGDRTVEKNAIEARIKYDEVDKKIYDFRKQSLNYLQEMVLTIKNEN